MLSHFDFQFFERDFWFFTANAFIFVFLDTEKKKKDNSKIVDLKMA